MGYYQSTPPPAPKKGRRKGFVIAALVAVIGVCLLLCGGIVSALSANTAAEDVPSDAHTVEMPVSVAPRAAKSSASSTKQTPAVKTYQINGDDVVHVGEDVPAGTYRAAVAVDDGGLCYWVKSSDSEAQKIISNGSPQGGRPEVTLKSGQWFTSQGCPKWVRR